MGVEKQLYSHKVKGETDRQGSAPYCHESIQSARLSSQGGCDVKGKGFSDATTPVKKIQLCICKQEKTFVFLGVLQRELLIWERRN